MLLLGFGVGLGLSHVAVRVWGRVRALSAA